METDSDHELVSAVVIPMPEEVAAFAEAFQEKYGGADAVSVPPHITVMWPFVSLGTVADGADLAVLAATVEKLREVCRQVEPFGVTLAHYDTFPGVLYLAPQDPGPIVALHERILAVFPEYPPYGGQFGGLAPHMTLAIFETEEAFNAAPRPDFRPFTFRVDEVWFMYGDLVAMERWQLAAVIPLGGEK